MPQQSYLEINGKRVKVSNLEKVLYPATGFTKADVIDYYTRISPHLLPHLKDRPISLKRYLAYNDDVVRQTPICVNIRARIVR